MKKNEEKQEMNTEAEMPATENAAPTQKSKEQEFKELAQRLQADFENYKKRVEREVKDAREHSRIDAVKKFLPLLDSFEQAIIQVNKPETHEDPAALKAEVKALKKGFELIYAQLHAALNAEGVRPIECIGKQADPYLHDILLQQPSPKPHGEILEELQRGYTLGGAVLRHAKVKTSAGETNEHGSK